MTDWQPDRLTDWQADRPTVRTYMHALHYLSLPYLSLPYLTLPYATTLLYSTLQYITLQYTMLPCIALHCITLHYIAFHRYMHACIYGSASIFIFMYTHWCHSKHPYVTYIYINTLRIIWYAYTFCNESLKRSSQISTQMVLHGIELFSFSFFALNSHMVLFYLLLFRSVLFDLCSILFCLISF